MHPVCVVLDIERPGEKQPQNLHDDKAWLELGQRTLGDLGQGKRCWPNMQAPWGDTYNGINNEGSIKRLEVAIKAFQTSWEFWSQTRHQVREWSQGLADKTRSHLLAFLSDTAKFCPAGLKRYVDFLIRLFKSSRAALLLCMTRVTLLLSIAPWGETAPEEHDGLRLKALQALKEALGLAHAHASIMDNCILGDLGK